jgi:hypothetical protein
VHLLGGTAARRDPRLRAAAQETLITHNDANLGQDQAEDHEPATLPKHGSLLFLEYRAEGAVAASGNPSPRWGPTIAKPPPPCLRRPAGLFKAVSIYPVACSGYDDTAEFVFRASALLTRAQFLFLTNDSGVGAAHGEPHIPFYHVQKLDQLIVRMISSELSGRRLEPEPAQILRTVGKPPN